MKKKEITPTQPAHLALLLARVVGGLQVPDVWTASILLPAPQPLVRLCLPLALISAGTPAGKGPLGMG